mgnify:CR=1 FL=1
MNSFSNRTSKWITSFVLASSVFIASPTFADSNLDQRINVDKKHITQLVNTNNKAEKMQSRLQNQMKGISEAMEDLKVASSLVDRITIYRDLKDTYKNLESWVKDADQAYGKVVAQAHNTLISSGVVEVPPLTQEQRAQFNEMARDFSDDVYSNMNKQEATIKGDLVKLDRLINRVHKIRMDRPIYNTNGVHTQQDLLTIAHNAKLSQYRVSKLGHLIQEMKGDLQDRLIAEASGTMHSRPFPMPIVGEIVDKFEQLNLKEREAQPEEGQFSNNPYAMN